MLACVCALVATQGAMAHANEASSDWGKERPCYEPEITAAMDFGSGGPVLVVKIEKEEFGQWEGFSVAALGKDLPQPVSVPASLKVELCPPPAGFVPPGKEVAAYEVVNPSFERSWRPMSLAALAIVVSSGPGVPG